MGAIDLLKLCLSGIVELEVESIVKNVSKAIFPKTLRPIAKGGLALGTLLVSNAVAAKVSEKIETVVDEEIVEKEES